MYKFKYMYIDENIMHEMFFMVGTFKKNSNVKVLHI